MDNDLAERAKQFASAGRAEQSDILETYTFEEAGKLLKSSVHQLGRLVRKGYLEQVGGRRGGGGRRQITKRSIVSFQQNAGAIWLPGSASGASVVKARSHSIKNAANGVRERTMKLVSNGLVTFPTVKPLNLGDETNSPR
jgi:hypothetical protein